MVESEALSSHTYIEDSMPASSYKTKSIKNSDIIGDFKKLKTT